MLDFIIKNTEWYTITDCLKVLCFLFIKSRLKYGQGDKRYFDSHLTGIKIKIISIQKLITLIPLPITFFSIPILICIK